MNDIDKIVQPSQSTFNWKDTPLYEKPQMMYPDSPRKSVFDIQLDENPNTSPNLFSLPSF